jgi:hypothetical protein
MTIVGRFVMPLKHVGDYVLAPPSGSNVPGKVEANPYMSMPPKELRRMVQEQPDHKDIKKIRSALKQFERIYTYPGYPWRAQRAKRVLSNYLKISELVNPAINLPYYQDLETNQGQDEIIDSLKGLYDNDNLEKFDYARQGIRPIRDIDTAEGAFLNPKESPFGEQIVKPRGDGPDPDGMEYPDPPTGGPSGEF